jgi:hypothetical protein
MSSITLPGKNVLTECYEYEMYMQGQDFFASKTVDTIAKLADSTFNNLDSVASSTAFEFAKKYEPRNYDNQTVLKSDASLIKKALIACAYRYKE